MNDPKLIEPRRYQWMLALLIALAAHLALAKLLEPAAPIELDAPGIRIALGGAGPAGGEGAADAVDSVTADILPSATLQTTAIQTVSPPALAPVLATATETIRAAEPAPPPPVSAAHPATPKQKAETVRNRETPPPRTARAAPKPKQAPETEAQIEKPRTHAARTASADAAGKATGKQSAGGAAAPSAAGATGGGTSGKAAGGKSKDRYYAELAAWLERHKRYPSHARKLRQEGIVRVRFVIDRSGKVISHRIEASSGHTALDQAASELLRRASPMPAIPTSMGRSRLEIVVPIAYRLR